MPPEITTTVERDLSTFFRRGRYRWHWSVNWVDAELGPLGLGGWARTRRSARREAEAQRLATVTGGVWT